MDISAEDIKWDFDEHIKKWSKKNIKIYSVSDELSNNEFNGSSLSKDTVIEVVDEDTGQEVFSTTLDKESLEKYYIKISNTKRGINSLVNGTKVIVETGSQGDVNVQFKLETDTKFDPSKLVIETYEIDDDVLINNIEYKDTSSNIDFEDIGYDDKGCTPEYVVVENGITSKNPHSFKNTECSDWFDISIKPKRNGFYEVKKCDEEVNTVLLKWNGKNFVREQEDYDLNKKYKKINIRMVDVIVPFHDIVSWRGLNKEVK
ncbi:MAG: hypothetical protein K9J38_01185 [Polynucleobacter sp.]|nr:hypothetical protein [Polynucleobacter sp.]